MRMGLHIALQPNTCYFYPSATRASLEPASTGSGRPLSPGALDPGEEAVGSVGQSTSSSQSQESLGSVPTPHGTLHDKSLTLISRPPRERAPPPLGGGVG